MRLGIDFGTSHTKLGYIDDNRFINLAGSNNSIPSVVTYLPAKQKLYFGHLAIRLEDPKAYSAHLFKLALKRDPAFCLGPYTLSGILTQFFAFLNNTYVLPHIIDFDSIVVSIPNYFGLNARRILLNAVRAGFNLDQVELLLEPIAAVIGYSFSGQLKQINGDILSIDVGGGTTDFSFLSISGDSNDVVIESQFQIGNDAFSGSEIDRGILRNILLPAYKIQTGLELPTGILTEKCILAKDRYLFNRLLQISEKIKIEAGVKDTISVDIPDFYKGQSLLFSLPKETFKLQLQPIFERFKIYFNQLVKPRAQKLNLYTANNKWNLDYIFLFGGASQTPGILELVKELCPDIPVIIPNDPYFNVVKGLCARDNFPYFGSMKALYPFSFCIEQKETHQDSNSLYIIPFDTGNLPLDINGRYKIFSIAPTSIYNLAGDSNRVCFKIFEVTEEEANLTVERFSGQEIVLQVDTGIDSFSDIADIYLNFARSELELKISKQPAKHLLMEDDIFDKLHNKQRLALNLVKEYKLHNLRLIKDYSRHFNKMEKTTQKPYANHLETTFYKVLALLQFLSGK
jgi:actin-like ATPase involved in cell morphogenesis